VSGTALPSRVSRCALRSSSNWPKRVTVSGSAAGRFCARRNTARIRREQLARVERLRDVVVRADFQTDDAVDVFALRGKR
jgi:hypothetical protein